MDVACESDRGCLPKNVHRLGFFDHMRLDQPIWRSLLSVASSWSWIFVVRRIFIIHFCDLIIIIDAHSWNLFVYIVHSADLSSSISSLSSSTPAGSSSSSISGGPKCVSWAISGGGRSLVGSKVGLLCGIWSTLISRCLRNVG